MADIIQPSTLLASITPFSLKNAQRRDKKGSSILYWLATKKEGEGAGTHKKYNWLSKICINSKKSRDKSKKKVYSVYLSINLESMNHNMV